MSMIELTIESNIQPPASLAVVDRIPWKNIKVGQSFAITKEAFGENAVERVRTAISYRQKATTERFSVRKMAPNSYRCFRIA